MRQTSLLTATAALWVLAACATANAVTMLEFGLITDIHQTDKPDPVPPSTATRYYTGALAKTEAFASAMNAAGASFVIELGDFSDRPKNEGTQSLPQNIDNCLQFAEQIEAKYATFAGPRYHVFGNHDTDYATKAEYLTKVTNTGITYPGLGKYYYSFDQGGVHCVVLDASFKKQMDGSYVDLDRIVPSGYTWLDTWVPDHELNWLRADLAAANKPTLVFAHQLLDDFPVPGYLPTDHAVKNSADVRQVLEGDGQVIGVLQGHWHGGGYSNINNIHYMTFKGNIENGTDLDLYNQYAQVSVSDLGNQTYQVAVSGHGQQPNMALTTTVPEPASLTLLGAAGVLALVVVVCRRCA